MMVKCTPQTFCCSWASSPMFLPRPTPNLVCCCVAQFNGGHLSPWPSPSLWYFLSIYFKDRTDETAHPHAFCLSHVSSLTPLPSLTPILFDCCVLICKTGATFKAQAPPPPSIFWSLCFRHQARQHKALHQPPCIIGVGARAAPPELRWIRVHGDRLIARLCGLCTHTFLFYVLLRVESAP